MTGGDIRFDHFMAQANAAFYAAKNPFEDFTTSPEISQVFGEVLGAWAKTVWALIGAPQDFILAEAGPGRGTLMQDALRVFKPAPEIHFIEASPRLRAEQAERVPHATWHDALDSVPHKKLILLANEFLDALPVRQFVNREAGWFERHVSDGTYREHPADVTFPDPVGSVREINEGAEALVAEVARRGAIALFIDYGSATGAAAATVQAISGGKFASPLENPGQADITAHVDFSRLARVAKDHGAATQGPIKQNAFLTALGLFQRTGQLAQQHPDRAEALMFAARRLTAPEAMGSLFKVFAVCPENCPVLPGFE